MGLDGEDFIANPYRVDTTDDELDLDETSEVIVDYMGDEDDLMGLDDLEDDDDEDFDIESTSDTDDDDDDSVDELRGTIINGVFTETGWERAPMRIQLELARYADSNSSEQTSSNSVEQTESKHGNEAANVNQTQTPSPLPTQPDFEGS
ncbi:uncharacterized protein F23B12.7-like isoform X2 [Atheta coriaria]|uniref:uncharacterized protein F23B12.7-like isoform X2 n=1 Tax=Dalotia coriaria TaxID=877792 RepID=UPI0031F473E6